MPEACVVDRVAAQRSAVLNADWRRLLSFQERGIAIVPMKEVSSTHELIRTAREWGEFGLAVRPVRGPASAPAIRGRATEPAFVAQLGALPSEGGYVVQVDVESLDAHARWSLVLVAGRVALACRVDAEGRRVGDPPGFVRDAAIGIVEAADSLGFGGLDRVRIDGIACDGEFLLESFSAIPSESAKA